MSRDRPRRGLAYRLASSFSSTHPSRLFPRSSLPVPSSAFRGLPTRRYLPPLPVLFCHTPVASYTPLSPLCHCAFLRPSLAAHLASPSTQFTALASTLASRSVHAVEMAAVAPHSLPPWTSAAHPMGGAMNSLLLATVVLVPLLTLWRLGRHRAELRELFATERTALPPGSPRPLSRRPSPLTSSPPPGPIVLRFSVPASPHTGCPGGAAADADAADRRPYHSYEGYASYAAAYGFATRGRRAAAGDGRRTASSGGDAGSGGASAAGDPEEIRRGSGAPADAAEGSWAEAYPRVTTGVTWALERGRGVGRSALRIVRALSPRATRMLLEYTSADSVGEDDGEDHVEGRARCQPLLAHAPRTAVRSLEF